MEDQDFPFPVVADNKLTPLGEKVFKVQKALAEILAQMTSTAEDVVMDIGCGRGYKTAFALIPLIKKHKVFLAIDANPKLVEFGSRECPAEKLEYHEANIEKISTFKKEWQGKVAKIISIDCFHCLKDDPRVAFKNVFALMAPGGQAVIYFKISSPLRDVCEEMAKDSKWKEYVNDPICRAMLVNPCHKLEPVFYWRMLSIIGFEVLICEKDPEILVSTDDKEFRDLWKASCNFLDIPKEKKEEFDEFVYQTILKHHGRNCEGKPLMIYNRLLLHLRKPIV